MANLRFACSQCATPIEGGGESRLLRSLLFWHFDTSQQGRARVGLVSFTLLCGVLSAVLAVSVGVRAYQEGRRQEGVLVQPDSVARKGNGSGYEQQFNEPLGAGVGFVILETRPDADGARWYRVRFPNGTQGWIPGEAGQII